MAYRLNQALARAFVSAKVILNNCSNSNLMTSYVCACSIILLYILLLRKTFIETDQSKDLILFESHTLQYSRIYIRICAAILDIQTVDELIPRQ